LLSVLAAAAREQEFADLVLWETTTLGVRVHPVHRHEAQRAFTTVETTYGSVQVKLKYLNGRIVSAKPEYEDCQRLADQAGLPLRQVTEAAQAAAYQAYAENFVAS
jgi:pyridinium-3,5-bisthiocarboxylic acid mononucleotide nickel chelatase